MRRKRTLTLCLVTVIVTVIVLTLGLSAYAFSDGYEPIYPHVTAVTRSVDDIYNRISGTDITLPEEVVTARREMIQMYKNVGIDVSYDMEDWSQSYKTIANFPQSWSTQTPKPLGTSPDYSGAFSVDAPWNNKIPEDAPRVYIPRTAMSINPHLAVVKANVDAGGWGTGIPQIVSASTDPYYTIACKYNLNDVSKVYRMRAKENLYNYVNNSQTGDEHIQFIDSETNTGVQVWKGVVPGDPRGYSLSNYLIPNFDIRSKSAGVEYKLNGIGAEGQAGVNAANTPTNAYTIKSSEISSTTEMINHAIGGAIPKMVGARVFPAISTDSHMAMESDGTGSNGQYNTGVVPYGGVIQLDPELDIKAMYDNGKLSFHAYRILTAMQEYGFYNIDCSGGSSFMFYTSTYANDWVNADFEGFNVPYKDNAQGFTHVNSELTAFFNGDSFFGLTTEPNVYVTVPVAKYADLDVNDDGTINTADYDLVSANADQAYSDTTKQYDVNQDGVITTADADIMTNYLNDQVMHTFNWYSATYTNNDTEHGRIVGSALKKTIDGVTKYREGMYVSFAAVPVNGYEFAGWTGDFAEYGDTPVVKLEMDRDYSFGATYRMLPEKSFTVNAIGPGQIKVSEDGTNYTNPSNVYGENTLLCVKAVPEEGYEFLGWSGDITGSATTVNYLVSDDTQITAMFGLAGYEEPFVASEWELKSGSASAYTITEGSKIKFSDWAQSNMLVINKNESNAIDLTGDFILKAKLSNSSSTNEGNQGKMVFNYVDNQNYYLITIGGNGKFILKKVVNGTTTTLHTVAGNQTVNGVEFSKTVTMEVARNGNTLTITGHKDGESLEYCSIDDSSLSGGTYGFGTKYNGIFSVSNVSVTLPAEEKTFIVNTEGNGHIEVSVYGSAYGTPQEKYGRHTLLNIRAVPDDGYGFYGWSGDITGNTNPVTYRITDDTEITAVFGEVGYVNYTEPFVASNWELKSGSASAYTITEGSKIKFSDWSQSNMLVVKNNDDNAIDLTGNFTLKAKLSNSASTNEGNQGKMVFNYVDNQNYYLITIGGNGKFILKKVVNGTTTTLHTVAGNQTVNGVEFSRTVTMEVVRNGSNLTITGYKDGESLEYCSIEDASLIGGTYGFGTKYNGIFSVSEVVLTMPSIVVSQPEE